MLDRIANHPSGKELQAYGQGRLVPEASQALEEHLAGCATCCEHLAGTPSDSFLSRLRQVCSSGPDALGRDTRIDPATAGHAGAAAIPPELVGHPRYRVHGLVGQGGMGAVYRAEHRRMERLVALKLIHPRLMRQPGTVQRFQQEVRAAARLHHPNIVHAYDADQAGELHFLVMEYVEGTSLAELVRERGPLPVAEACEYARQAALGLQHAHEQGMVHRDIKPANLMVVSDELSIRAKRSITPLQLKILDFGLARLTHTVEHSPRGAAPTGSLTAAGTVMGTVDYIAPEQAADPRKADIRADIYALGCTLFYLLTGQPPFPDGSVLEKLAQHAGTPLPTRPEVPAGLAAVLARMTAKDPAGRHATPSAVAAALAPFCPPGTRPPLERKRSWLLAASLVLLAAGLLTTGLVATGLLAVAFFGHRGTQPSSTGIQTGGPEPPPPVLPAPVPAEPPDPVLSEEEAAAKAVQAIQALGGRVNFNDHGQGRHSVGSVNLNGSGVKDADLVSLAAFKQLRFLDLSRSQVTDAGLKHLTGLKHLAVLILSNTRVTGTGFQHLAELKELRVLHLEYSTAGDVSMKHLAGLPELQTLTLRGTRVTDAGMNDVGRLMSLEVLSLDNTEVTDTGLKGLTGLTELRTLGLTLNRGVGDEGMKSVARLKGLRSLDLFGTRVTDAGMESLAEIALLNTLGIGGLKITDVGVQALADLTELKDLDLSGADITDEGLKEVARHDMLERLNVQSSPKVTDAGLKELAVLTQLHSLILAGTRLGDTGLKELLTRLPHLKFMTLGGTDITDAGLKELARNQSLTLVNLVGAAQVTDAGVAELRMARPQLKVQR